MNSESINVDREIILKKEILKEITAGLLAKIDRIIEKNNLGENEQIHRYEDEIVKIYNNIYGAKYRTMEDLKSVDETVKKTRNYIESQGFID